MNPISATLRRTSIQPIRSPCTGLQHSRKMHIQSIPMWKGKGNNYAYLVSDDSYSESVIIDPANPPEVLAALKPQLEKLNLKKIINTHHHHDHAGGNNTIRSSLSSLNLGIIGGKDCESVETVPAHNSTFTIGKGIKVTALHTPCHTQDSICFYMEDGSDRVVFTGDTLFIGGCGRLFEGSPKEMHKALNEVLAALPDDTKVFPGHEYTKGNVKFAISVLPDDPEIKRLNDFATSNEETQGKSTIGDEKKYNVFMRVADPAIQKYTGETEPVAVLAKLRSAKDNA